MLLDGGAKERRAWWIREERFAVLLLFPRHSQQDVCRKWSSDGGVVTT
jgi:hypothetical protein